MSNVKAFQCPNCQNYINNLMEVCKFCSIPISPEMLNSAVGKEDFINNAYSAASNIRNGGAGLGLTFLLSFIPFVGWVPGIGHYILLAVMPFGILYWVLRFGTTKLDDPNFNDAKKNVWIGAGIWLAFVILRIILIVLAIAMISSRRY